MGIYHPKYLLYSVTWLVAVDFGIFCDSVGMSHVLPNISRGRFFEPILRPKNSTCTRVYTVPVIDFFSNLRRAIKLVLNLPTRLSTVVSVGLLRMR